MLVMLWRILTKVLRHLGWGLLLVPVAAMGMALFGLNLWTLAAVVLATVVAVQWPAAAARALPPTMVGAGLSGLLVAGRISGSPVSWVMSRFTAVGKGVPIPAQPGLAGPRWITITPNGGMQVALSPKAPPGWAINVPAAVAKRLPGKGKGGGAQRVFLPKQAPAPPEVHIGATGPGARELQGRLAACDTVLQRAREICQWAATRCLHQDGACRQATVGGPGPGRAVARPAVGAAGSAAAHPRPVADPAHAGRAARARRRPGSGGTALAGGEPVGASCWSRSR